MRFKITETYRLNEDIESMKKFYPNITDDAFMSFVALDPTYKKGSTTAGKYARYILGMANKGNGKIENISHITDALRRFEDAKNDLVNKDVMKYKSVQELEDALNSPESYEEKSHRQEVRGRQQARKEADIERDADVAYKDSEWTVYVPKTYAASCKLGQGSKWCTASTESDYYYNYYLSAYPDSKYYIVINNQNPNEKYQLHFESHQFMDADDYRIPDGIETFEEDTGLYKFLKDTQINLFFKQIGVSPDIKEHIVNIDHDDLAGDLSSLYSRDALDSDSISMILDGNAFELYNFEFARDDEIRYAYDNTISKENMEKIKELGAAKESIFDNNDDVYYAIADAISDATIDNAVRNIEKTVEQAVKNALPRWAKLEKIGYGEADTTFTVNTESFINSISRIDATYDVENAESLGEILGTVISDNSNGVYVREYGYYYDEDTFNKMLAERLAEIEPQ